VVEKNRNEGEYFVTAFLPKDEIYITVFLKYLYVIFKLALRLSNNNPLPESGQWLKIKQEF
jgi:hypothetical protein